MDTTSASDPSDLSDAAYQGLAEAALSSIEATIDAWLQADVVDIDTHRTGGLLELSFAAGSKIVINMQPPLHELWLAARTGGYHYRWRAGQWRDTRDGSEFFEALSREVSRQAGQVLRFTPPT